MVSDNLREGLTGLAVLISVAVLGYAEGYHTGYQNAQKKAEVQNKVLREQISRLESRPTQTNLIYAVDGFVDTNLVSISKERHDEALMRAIQYAEQLNSSQGPKENQTQGSQLNPTQAPELNPTQAAQ